MKTLLFIGHGMHKDTASSAFFEKLLETRFVVERAYLPDGPNHSFDVSLLERARTVDLVVLWQRDFLAPVFLGMGIPTIVIPMYDGSANMPDLHWLFAKQARFVNFSLYLNEKLRFLGNQTYLARYFPEPVPESQRARFDKTRLFLWTRRPQEGLNLHLIRQLLDDQIKEVHLHDAPDPGGHYPSNCSAKDNFRYQVTRTSWGQSRETYSRAIASCNLFFAPRKAEGIGMAFLEAMARGMIVIAWDLPTHNEYIANFVNGILTNDACDHIPLPSGIDADAIGYQAWRTVVEGRKAWEASIPTILNWIESTPVPTRSLSDPAELATQLWNRFFESFDGYVAYLSDQRHLIEYLSGLDQVAVERLARGAADAPQDMAPTTSRKALSQISPDDADRLRRSGTFDEAWYLERYPDVALLDMDPAEHYLWIGQFLGRSRKADLD